MSKHFGLCGRTGGQCNWIQPRPRYFECLSCSVGFWAGEKKEEVPMREEICRNFGHVWDLSEDEVSECISCGELDFDPYGIKEEDVIVSQGTLPQDAKERKNIPMCTGVLDYFPDALAEIAIVSKAGNDQHNPGQPLHWAKEKSTDHADCIVRHLTERGIRDTDGMRHSAKVAWRALALLQTEIENEKEGN